MINELQPFLLSFLIGMLIGIERERRHAEGGKRIGVRTFILFSLLGTLAAKINAPPLTLSLSLFVFTTIGISYVFAHIKPENKKPIGMTTELAGGLVFVLGFLMLSHMLLTICIATAVLSILQGQKSLHRFAKEKITAGEIEASITIIIIALIIISFLPDRAVDPWQLFNPQNFGMILLILAGLQFGGHIAIRLFGEKLGMLFLGFFGGFISSTAVFASLAHQKIKKYQSVSSAVVAGVFATISTLIGFVIVILVVIPELVEYIILPIIAIIVTGAISASIYLHYYKNDNILIHYPNPLDLKAIIKLSLLISIILIFVGITKQYVGASGLPILAFITGLFEIHAMAYAIATLYSLGSISSDTAANLLAVTIFAGFISKFALVWIIAHNRFALIVSIFLLGMLSIGCLVFFLPVNA